MVRKALVVELTYKHTHVIYPQCALLLEQGFEVTLLFSTNALDPELIYSLQDRVHLVEFSQTERWRDLFTMWRNHAFQDYEFVIFNTLEKNARHLLFAVLFSQPIHFILHFADPVGEIVREHLNFEQGLLYRILARRAKRIYVLSERILSHSQPQQPQRLRSKMTYFHPAFFPGFAEPALPPLSDDGRIVFAVPGKALANLRDYASLCAALPRLVESSLADRIQINIMGEFWTPAGRDLVVQASQLGLLGSTIQLQRHPYLPFDAYAQRLNAAHFILPLIDDKTINIIYYNKCVAPSALMISRGFWIPLVSSTDFDLDQDLVPFAVQYEGDNLFDGLKKAVALYDSPQYATMRTRYREHMHAHLAESAANLAGLHQPTPVTANKETPV
ncbi:MAG: hypothetical protein GYB65_22760 [Chloroflexi bacterium]|nr:hypothetical protein [Chloroflexota bacterium]